MSLSDCSFSRKKNKIIALCSAGCSLDYQDTIKDSVVEYAEKLDYKVLIFSSFSDLYCNDEHDIGQSAIFSLMNLNIIDGIIVLSETIKSDKILNNIIDSAKASNIPVVSIDKQISGCFNIIFSYGRSIEKIVEHFVKDHKFTRLNFIAGIKDNDFSEERVNAYKKVLNENGIPFEKERLGYGQFWANPTYDVIDSFMHSGLERPQAIICANDSMAIAACQKLQEYNLEVPEDICVSGFDGIKEGRYHVPKLTTAQQDFNEAALAAVNILNECFSGKIPDKTCIKIPNKVLISQSCGCYGKCKSDSNIFIRNLYSECLELQRYAVRLIRMSSDITEGQTYDNVINKIKTYIMQMATDKAWVCIVDDFISDVNCMDDINNCENRLIKTGYSDSMQVILYRNNDRFEKRNDFLTSEMIPDLFKILDKYSSILFVPMHYQNKPIGYIATTSSKLFSDMNQYYSFTMNISECLEIVKTRTEMNSLIKKLENMYIHDPLTRLLNRRGFYKNISAQFEQCIEKKQYLMVVSIDLDGLKYINDVFGHAEGDNAIQTVAKALASAAIKDEVCARFGGDEFIVASIVADKDKYVQEFISRFNQYLDYYNEFSGKDYSVQASYGIYVQLPTEGMTLDGLIEIADAIMYSQKAKNKNFRDQRRD